MGYVPIDGGGTLPGRLRAYRRVRGLSRKRFAAVLRVDEGTLWRWETGERYPQAGHRERVEEVLAPRT
jgi:transcriptional regulator with XRE-family HTH domain